MASKKEITNLLNTLSITENDLDHMWEFCSEFGHPIITPLNKQNINWRDLRTDLIEQIPKIYTKMVNRVIFNKEE